MKVINPYLLFNGNCEEAFDFYKSVFGGGFASKMTFREMPTQYSGPGDENKIAHISLPMGKMTVLMGCDRTESGGPGIAGDNFSITITTDSQKEADDIFGQLSVGGQVMMEMQKTSWGAYFGAVIDKFRIAWMVNYELPQD